MVGPALPFGAWPASTRRRAASSVALGLSSPSALASAIARLGAVDPGIRKQNRADH
jgi:hypothetical protein